MHTLLKHTDIPGHPPSTCIGLLRHGKTLWNEEGRIQGTLDSPLSPSGRDQVEQWGAFLHDFQIDQIVASDMGRVRETVAILHTYCPQAQVLWNPSLREQHWGDWEGRSFKEIQETEAELLNSEIRNGWDFCPPHGESRREVLQRSLPIIHELVTQLPGKQILVVCHEGILKTIIYHLAGRAFLPEEKKLLQKRQMHLLVGHGNTLRLGPLNILPQCNKSETP